jgi:hypothetical protein
MRRHAPKTGYGFDVKQNQYRRKLWSWVDLQFDNWIPKRKRVVAYLDTSEGLETLFLLGLGYYPQNIHAVNFDPAQVAALSLKLDRLGLQRVQTHGKDFIRTLTEAKVKTWHVMSFDGCGPIASPNTLRCIRQMAELASVGTILAANVLAGRDTGRTAELLRETKAGGGSTHERRWYWIERAFTVRQAHGHVRQLWSCAAKKRGIYLSSSGQPMLWLAVRIGLPRDDRDHFSDITTEIRRSRASAFHSTSRKVKTVEMLALAETNCQEIMTELRMRLAEKMKKNDGQFI